MSKQRRGSWKQGRCGEGRGVQGAGQAQTQQSQGTATLPLHRFAAAAHWRMQGRCLLVCWFNGQTKPWNLWACLSTANEDNGKPFAEALKRSKNVFSAFGKGKNLFFWCGSAALVLTSVEISQFADSLILHWGDPCQADTACSHNSSGFISN